MQKNLSLSLSLCSNMNGVKLPSRVFLSIGDLEQCQNRLEKYSMGPYYCYRLLLFSVLEVLNFGIISSSVGDVVGDMKGKIIYWAVVQKELRNYCFEFI